MMRLNLSLALVLTSSLFASAQVPNPATKPDAFLPVSIVLPEKIDLQKIYTLKSTPPDPTEAKDPELAAFNASFEKVQVVGMEIARDEKIEMRVITREDRTSETDWKLQDVRARTYSDRPGTVLVIPIGADRQKLPDFSELEWIKKGDFVRQDSSHGRPCDLYQAGDQQVWIDRETHLPVHLETSALTIDYVAKPVPELHLPPAVLHKIQEYYRQVGGH